MSKYTLAVKLADEFGVSVAKASRYIDDVGSSLARRTLDDAARIGSKTVGTWWKPAAAGTAVVGTGALVYRQQDVLTAEALAKNSESYNDGVQAIMDSDLPAELKAELTRELVNTAAASTKAADEGAGGLLGDDTQTTVILLVVLVFALKFALDGD